MAEIFSNDVLRDALRKAEDMQDQLSRRGDYELAIDYLGGKQLNDVDAQLRSRYNLHQSGEVGEQIKSIAIPLTQRFVAESANLYNRPVTYELVGESGEVDDGATEVLQRFLDDSDYNDSMQQIDMIVAMLRSCGGWYQARRNLLQPRTIAPNVIWPIPDPAVAYPDKTDPGDYLGFTVQLTSSADHDALNQYVLITQAEHIYYRGQSPFEFDTESVDRFPVPYSWPQVIEDTVDGIPTGTGSEADDQLLMLTMWHSQRPLDSILVDTDPDIAWLNREINVAWSVIAHLIRTQAHSQMVINSGNPTSAPARLNYGPMFALSLDTEESASFISAANNYTETVDALQSMVRLFALSHRMSPNDFAIEGTAPASGFAKLVDSLPKIEARKERIARSKRTQETVAWPRIGAIMKHLGLLANPEAYRMRVTFSELEFPKTADEEIKMDEHEYRHGLSSPARNLASDEGLTIDEAQARIDADRAEPEQPAQQSKRFGDAIRRKGKDKE